MEPSLRLVPAPSPKHASLKETANSLGLHDTLEYGPRSFAAEVATTSGIRDRLQNWQETQDNLHLTMQRNLYGLHMPMRLLMERQMVTHSPHMPALRRSNIHLDILMGRDETLECADFMMPVSELAQPLSIHGEMEKKLRM
ncbi:Probable proteasome maturation factor [Sparassis crispa]|uniref:Probable proteasome maturation factor n=1 Tax=Sparassis crispa TaxID=139825 RepID=A0A401G966_9APHY|nr:Probable proteasome maturation factor [Sparassis crispa]GBE78726.1 Probable proteasome maturation factor [Sparassis crispa]